MGWEKDDMLMGQGPEHMFPSGLQSTEKFSYQFSEVIFMNFWKNVICRSCAKTYYNT